MCMTVLGYVSKLQIYYEKYATDKARYDREMEDYHRSKQQSQPTAAATTAAATTAAATTAGPAAAPTTEQTLPMLLHVGEELASEP